MNVIKNERLTYFQQVLELAKIWEDTLGDFLKTDELKKAMDEGITVSYTHLKRKVAAKRRSAHH